MPRAGAVLAVLLTALLHVLGCAHGPTADPALRADAPLYASSAPTGSSRRTGPGRRPPGAVHLPLIRGRTAAPWTHRPSNRRGTAARWPGPWSHPGHRARRPPSGRPPSALHPSRAPSPVSSDGSTRALLGVWRN
ncbi:hypothetical protein O1L55_11920 [Streptomyces albulus]|nr:hypothetical protein [Streptomyces noursei]